MKHKQKIALLSVASIPAVITMTPDIDVQAAANQPFSGTIVNPDHEFDGKSQPKRSLAAPSSATSIEAKDEAEFKDALKAQFENYSTNFVVTYTGSTVIDLETIIKNFVSKFGGENDIDNEYIEKTIISIDYLSSGYKNNIVTFTVKYHTDKTKETAVDAKIKQIIESQLPSIDTMSEFEKVKTIHDYVVKNASYASNTTASPHSAYALLHEGKGVSQAYALVTYRLLKEAKLNVHFVSGKVASGTHAWNIVEVDSKWYHLDTTWDDSTFSNVSDATDDFVRYKYFLMPDNMMTTTHKFTSNDYPFNKGLTDDKFKEMAAIQQPFKDGSTLYFGSTIAPYKLSKLDLAKNPLKVEPVVADATHTTKKRIVLNEGWLFFSDDANGGYLTKVQTNGKNLTVLDKTNASDLKISGTNLEYKKADNTTGKIPLAATSSGPTVGEVSKLIGNIGTDPYAATLNEPDKPLDAHDPYDHSYIDAVIVAKVAYDQLTKEQQDNVTDPNPLKKAITNIETGTNKIYEVMWKIALLDETAKSFKVDVIAARQLFADLPSDAHRQAVKNIKDLDAAWDKINDFADVVDVVRDKINKINPNFTNYYQKIKEARDAYDALTLAQRELLKTELTDLEDKERLMAEDETAVFDINYRLNLLDDTKADFKESFTAIDILIKDLKDSPGTAVANKKTLIKTMKFYNASQITFTAYDKTAKALENRLAEIAKVKPPVLADVQKLYADFQALNDAQKGFLTSSNFESDLKKALAEANAALNTADYVEGEIGELKVADSDFIKKVKDARGANDALDPAIKIDATKLAKLVEAEKIVVKIETIINNLKTLPTKASDVPSTNDYVKKVEELEKRLILLGKNLDFNANVDDPENNNIDVKLNMKNFVDVHITDKSSLITARDNITKGKEVDTLIEGLAADATYAQVKAVRDMHSALTPIGKLFVTKLADLEALETQTNQKEATAVAELINRLVETATDFIKKLAEANEGFNNLTPAQKDFIDNPTKLKLEDFNRIAAARIAVYNAIEAISEADVHNYVTKYTAAKTAYDALKPEEKTFITNTEKLEAAKANIDAANAVSEAIDTLTNASDEATIHAVEEKHKLLDEFQQKLVTNYKKLESLLDKINGKEAALVVVDMISKLDETKKTFAVDVKRAREAYDALTPKQKEYVTNYEDLLKAEKIVAGLVDTSDIAKKMIAQIAAINNTSASFKTDVDATKNAYAALSEEQQALVNNYNVLKEHLATYDTYAATAKKLEDKINALSDSNSGYQAALAALQSEYNAFNAAQKAFVPEYAVKLLNAAQSGIDAVRNVTNMILALNQYKFTFHADVANARAAYNALIKNHGVYLSAYLEEALERAEALVEKDKTAARKVVNAINSLSSDSILKEIQRARRVYNNLTALQRSLVTNLQTLIDFETGKLSYNTSGIPDGVDTEDKDTNSEEKNPLPDFAAIPGERTAMTKSKGDTYTAQIYVSNEVGNAERFVLTTRANVTAIIPPTVTVIGDKTGTMAIEIQATSSRISFKATIGKKPVTFASEVDIILESVPRNSIILRVDQDGNRVPASYTIDGDQYTIKTKSSDTFIITRQNTLFSDIQNDSHKEYIEELAARNIIQSTNDGKFNPNQHITRSEFAVMMARALDIQPSTSTSFNDIKGKSYENEVQALYEIGIIQGVNSTTFNPNSTLTRQQAAMMVERMLDYVNVDTDIWESPQFTDAHLIADGAINAVALMQSLEIVSGKPNGSFDPLGKLTRSQLAKILYKALQTADLL